MQKWQFSIRDLLLAIAVVAIWLWLVQIVLPGAEAVRMVQFLIVLGFMTLILRRDVRNSWLLAALLAGVISLVTTISVYWFYGWPILAPLD